MFNALLYEIDVYSWVIECWIRAYYPQAIFVILVISSFVYLYMTTEELRQKFLLPIAVMMFVVLNPVLYIYVFSKIVYWRLLWMLPGAILIGAAIVTLLNRQNRVWLKWGVLLIAITIIMSQGQYAFSYGVFFPKSNWEKISQETIDVCDAMLELDESPYAIVFSPIYSEVRQYAPEVSLLFGRDVELGYIRDVHAPGYGVYLGLNQEPREFAYALDIATNYGYNFVVSPIHTPFDQEVLDRYEFIELKKTAGHIIYYNSNIDG